MSEVSCADPQGSAPGKASVGVTRGHLSGPLAVSNVSSEQRGRLRCRLAVASKQFNFHLNPVYTTLVQILPPARHEDYGKRPLRPHLAFRHYLLPPPPPPPPGQKINDARAVAQHRLVGMQLAALFLQ